MWNANARASTSIVVGTVLMGSAAPAVVAATEDDASSAAIDVRHGSLSDAEGWQGWLRSNVDHGDQTGGGSDAVVLGTLADRNLDPGTADGSTWAPMTLSSSGSGVTATSDDSGTLRLFVGTDTGFESLTSIHHASAALRLARQDHGVTS